VGYKAGNCSFSKAVPDVAKIRGNWQMWKKIPTDFNRESSDVNRAGSSD
jgi:hypothetical protein